MNDEQDQQTLAQRVRHASEAMVGRRRLLIEGAAVLGAAAISPILSACSGNGSSTPAAATAAATTATTPSAATQSPTTAATQASTPAAATAAATAGAAPTQASGPAAPANSPKAVVYLSVLTEDMIARGDGWPAFVPAYFEVPADTEVTVHITNFDGSDDMSDASLVQYTKVSGTNGNTVLVQPIQTQDPNKVGAPKTQSQLDPKAGVSHTLTIDALGLNVPVAPTAVTSFTFKTPARGTYHWECHVPCGAGPTGLTGAMVTPGYMVGTMTAF